MTLMRDEIFEQPGILERSLNEGLSVAHEVCRRATSFDPNFVFIAARGSSDNAATYARYLLESYTSLPVSLAAPSLFTLYKRPPDIKKAWVIGISQSGQTPDIVEVLSEGRKQGAFTLALTNDPLSPLAKEAHVVMKLGTGTKHSIAATKTYTAELAMMALLVAELADSNGLRVGLQRLPSAVQQALSLEEKVKELTSRESYKQAAHSLVLGRGYNFPTALEIALKLKEVAHVFASPYSAADFLHGPFTIVDKSLPALLVGANGPAIPGLLELAQNLRELGVEIISIGDDPGLLRFATPAGAALPLDLKGLPEALSPIVCVVPGQLLALHLAQARGLDPDHTPERNKVL
ncbi:MAG: SIS domain-containing protein [Chloroflexota bacterium]